MSFVFCRFCRMQLPEGTVTLMIMHVPRRQTADAVWQEMACLCDLTSCDFYNLPWNHRGATNIGYAFLSFTSTEAAQKCASAADGRRWTWSRKRQARAVRAARVQGVTANLELFVKNAEHALLQSGHVPRIFLNQLPIPLNDAVKMFCSSGVYHELLQIQDPRHQMSVAMPRPARPLPLVSANREEASEDNLLKALFNGSGFVTPLSPVTDGFTGTRFRL